MDIRSAQKRAWQNKVAKGFNTTDIPLEFCLLQGEIAEAFDAWRKGREDAGEELADVAIYLLSLAEMTGVDLQDEIEAEMAKNEARVPAPTERSFSPRVRRGRLAIRCSPLLEPCGPAGPYRCLVDVFVEDPLVDSGPFGSMC